MKDFSVFREANGHKKLNQQKSFYHKTYHIMMKVMFGK